MDRTAAATILDLSADASPADIRKRYHELYSEFQVRLANAVTPNLKLSYQKNLQQIQEACKVLVPDFAADAQQDLPSAEPTRSSNSAGGTAKVRDSRPQVAPRRHELSATDQGALPQSTTIAIIVSVACLALTAFFALQWRKERTAASSQIKSAQQQAEALKAAQLQLTNLQNTAGVLENGKFRVCNASREPLTINTFAASYRGHDGQLKTINSGFFGYPTHTLRPEGQRDLELVQGTTVAWDGSVIFYALDVTYRSNEYFLAGTWSEVAGDCLKISLD